MTTPTQQRIINGMNKAMKYVENDDNRKNYLRLCEDIAEALFSDEVLTLAHLRTNISPYKKTVSGLFTFHHFSTHTRGLKETFYDERNGVLTVRWMGYPRNITHTCIHITVSHAVISSLGYVNTVITKPNKDFVNEVLSVVKDLCHYYDTGEIPESIESLEPVEGPVKAR